MEIFTVTLLDADGDTVPWDRTFRTQDAAMDAVLLIAGDDRYNAVSIEPVELSGEGPRSVRATEADSVEFDDGDFNYDEWLVTRTILVDIAV